MIRRLQLVFFSVLYFSISSSFAQNKDWLFKIFDVNNGLSSLYVLSIAQDTQGYIWMGTRNGLSRFDGLKFVNYHTRFRDSSSLPGNSVNELLSDSKGRLVIGTSAGLCLYDPLHDNFKTIPYPINIDIRSFTEGKEGAYWAASSNGLICFSKDLKTSNTYQHQANDPSSIPETDIYKVIEDSKDKNILWIGTRSGIIVSFNKKTGKCGTSRWINPQRTVVVSLRNVNDSLLFIENCNIKPIVVRKSDLRVLSNSNQKTDQQKKGKTKSEDEFLFGTENGVLALDGDFQFKEHAFTEYTKALSVNSILKDKQGNYWLSTYKRGVVQAYKTNKHFSSPFNETLNNALVLSVMHDQNNSYWVGTDGLGLYRFDANHRFVKRYWSGFDRSSDFYSVFKIYQSKAGEIYVGAYNGFFKYNKKTDQFIHFENKADDPNSLSSNDVRDIIEDRHGRIWICTNGGGLNQFIPEKNSFKRFLSNKQHPNRSIVNDFCLRMFVSHDSLLWITTYFGVSAFNTEKQTFKNYDPETYPLSSHWVHAITEDKDQNIWIGTANGLDILNRKQNKITCLFKEDGLPENQINGLLKDEGGNIWINTSQCISKYDAEKKIFINYSKSDGFTIDEFKSSSYDADAQGQFYFGGQGGVVSFSPKEIGMNRHIPIVIIDELQLFNKTVSISDQKDAILKHSISYTKEIQLDFSQNIITLKFAALNFVNPQENRFACQMEGFEKTYHDIGHKTEATYTNLNPGVYTFKVIASNNDGVWNMNPSTIRIIIHPPFWRTKWMYACITFFSFLILYLTIRKIIIRQNDKQKIKLERLEAQKMHEIDLLKLQVFTNISHEFRTPLTLIMGPLEKLMNKIENSQEQNYYSLMYRNAQRLLRLVNQLLDFRKLEAGHLKLEATKDDIVLFTETIAHSFDLLASQRRMSYTCSSSISSSLVWFDPDKLDKILYNLISNAFKYSPDQAEIQITIDTCSKEQADENGLTEFIEIRVKDNGIGIPQDSLDKIFSVFYQVEDRKLTSKGTGIGLALTKELVLLHKGKIMVESELNVGSCFTLLLPMGNAHIQKNQMIERPLNLEEKAAEISSSFENLKPIDNLPQARKDETTPLVLVVEDNDEMRLFIKTELAEKYRVIEAADGHPGFDLAISEIPDLIISDVMMGAMNGIELCRKVKTDERTSHIPFILLTARKSEEHKLEGLDTGADDYVTKPFSSQILMARIKNLIESRRKLRELFGKGEIIEPEKITTNAIDEAFMKRAIELVEMHLSDGSFSIDDLAFQLKMSRAQLYKKLKSLTNQTIYDFIRTIRLNKAAQMLLKGEMNITQVAYAIGYAELPNFSRSFQAQFGESPKSFVARHRV